MTERADFRVVGTDDKCPAGGTLSLSIPDGIGRDDWLELGRQLSRGRDSSSWHIGDWARHGERQWGDLTAAAIEIGVARKTLYHRAGVTAGRDRHLTSLLNWRRAGPCLVRAPRRSFSGGLA